MRGLRQTDFYLRGAYGPSNLGDDILMMVCAFLIRQHHPHRQLLISAQHVDHAKRFLPGFEFVPLEEPVHANIAVLGGGGQFFSFGSAQQVPKRSIWRALRSMRWSTVARRIYLEMLQGRGAAFSSNKLLGLSLGIGPFENGATDYQYQRTRTYLQKMDYLTVRDAMSEQLCRQEFGVGATCYTDLSFARKYWLTQPDDTRTLSRRAKIGVVVRDWPDAGAPKYIIEQFLQALLKIKATNELVFISLDRRNDHALIAQYLQMEWLVWEPGAHSPEVFLRTIKQSCAFLFSMRAHGVLLPAAMNIPSIAVEIEPKLRNVQAMLPHGTRLIGEKDFSCLDQIINEFSQNLERYQSRLESEFASQEKLAETMIADFTAWTRQHA